MKKTLSIVFAVLLAGGCFAQKANVKKAQGYLALETPDYNGARAVISQALEDEETKNDAKTWYVAGSIGYQENQSFRNQKMLGQAIDEDARGAAIIESYDYWLKADELAMVPVLDKKGREVVDTKTRANIAKKMFEYYDKGEFLQYASYLYEQRDFKNAYKMFMKHVEIPDLPMMQDPKMQAKMPKDTLYSQYYYYAGLCAAQAGLHKEAAAVFAALKDGSYEAITCNQFLYQEYIELGDNQSAIEVLKSAVNKFPQEPWFLQNLINYYIGAGQMQDAINYLNEAIALDPNVAQYYLIKGNLEEDKGEYEAALMSFDKALEVDPTLADAQAGKGRVYYNQAVKINEKAAYIQDVKEYNAELTKMNDTFRKALPFFEAAHNLAPDNREYMTILKGLYYRFGMDKEEQAMKEALGY